MRLILIALLIFGCSGASSDDSSTAEAKPTITINHRTVTFAATKTAYEYEDSEKYTFNEQSYFAENVGLLIIDAWEATHNDGFDERLSANVRDYLAPFVDRMRDKGVQIFHMPYESWDRGNSLNVHPEDIVLNDGLVANDFYSMLQERGIHTLMMAGYALNYCLLQRPIGMWPLVFANQIESIVLVRDCTIAKETAETMPNFGAYHTIVNMVEMWQRGGTVQSNEVF